MSLRRSAIGCAEGRPRKGKAFAPFGCPGFRLRLRPRGVQGVSWAAGFSSCQWPVTHVREMMLPSRSRV